MCEYVWMHRHICFASMCCLICSHSLGFASQLCTAFFFIRTNTSAQTHLMNAYDEQSSFIGIAWSSQINAYKGVNLNYVHCTSFAGCITKPYWKSRFCYHLYYWRITRTHRSYTASCPCAPTDLLRGCHPFHFRSCTFMHKLLSPHHYDNRSSRPVKHLYLCYFRHPTYEDGVVD